MTSTGKFEEGIAEIDLAEEFDPLSLRTKTLVVWAHYQSGNFDHALAKAEEIIRLDPIYPQGHLQRGYVLCELGRPEEAVNSIRHSMRPSPRSPTAKAFQP